MIPKKSTLFKNILTDKDLRGHILSIVDEQVSNVSIIHSNAESIRSNHYHLTDWHMMYVLSGKIDYFFKEINSDEIKYLAVNVGDNIFTPPMEIHATYFPVKTSLIVSSLNPRDQKTYESDTVRVEFIDSNNIKSMLKRYTK